MALTSLFQQSLIGRADSPALDFELSGAVRTATFGEIDARANRLASELSSRGLSAGDRLC